jgi:hypothetical protein
MASAFVAKINPESKLIFLWSLFYDKPIQPRSNERIRKPLLPWQSVYTIAAGKTWW